MKQLLVAFDFSTNALKTLDYAVMIANILHAELHLVWVDATNTPDNVLNIHYELRIETKQLFEDIIAEYEPKLHNGKIDILLRKGKVYTEVATAARMVEADLVFAGTHGVSGFEQYWIGSNAYRIVTQSPCPVITVRGDHTVKEGIKKIVLPLDSSSETRRKLPLAVQLAKLFAAEIHLLLLFNSPVGVVQSRIRSYGDEAVAVCEKEQIPFVLKELKAGNLVKDMLGYAEENEIDMIMIMTEQGTTTANMFLGPYAQQVVNNARIPVLSLQSVNY
ncbi:MAG: universal stress protein [Bacteroidales bacterium]|nr:universal stress protein [Bacteroidales bacterium]